MKIELESIEVTVYPDLILHAKDGTEYQIFPNEYNRAKYDEMEIFPECKIEDSKCVLTSGDIILVATGVEI